MQKCHQICMCCDVLVQWSKAIIIQQPDILFPLFKKQNGAKPAVTQADNFCSHQTRIPLPVIIIYSALINFQWENSQPEQCCASHFE